MTTTHAEFVEAIQWNERGLVPAIAIEARSGELLMQAWMNSDALSRTLSSRQVWFWSRSRSSLWRKGATSGNTLSVCELRTDCDRDSIAIYVQAAGPVCHTGTRSCFFRLSGGGGGGEGEGGDGEGKDKDDDQGPGARGQGITAHPVDELALTILCRQGDDPSSSYTAKLLAEGIVAINEKIREEADELIAALSGESAERVANELADLIYHALVGLQARGVSAKAVWEELERRRGVSGLVEKANRTGAS